MHPKILYKFFTKLENDHFGLIYMGEFDDQLTATLMRINETSIEEPKMLKKKLSFLIVECFQNIIRHADKPELVTRTNNKPRMFLVRNTGNEFYIASTNLINNEKKARLEGKLKVVNTLSKEELKSEYLNALATGEVSDKGGGGLGLIEMSRRADCKLEFDFEFVNYFFSIFYMQLHVMSPNVVKDGSAGTITLRSTIELYNSMLAENILMIRKGDFSQESILPVLELIENNLNLQHQLPGLKKKTVYLLVEMLQNISKHASEHNAMREGIFIITFQNNKYTLNAGNYIDVDKVEPFKEKLKALVAMDAAGLAEAYKSNILNKDSATSKGAGLGLIEMSKYSSEKLKFNFIPVNDTHSFFSLNVTL
jgi:hypothetical protein